MGAKNILFIMCDQLRWDYLACYGHRTIRTPNIDRLAAKGVRFDRAYVQSPICGPSRMSFYTGRYARSHGSTWNNAPLRVGEMNIGDHLNPLGMRTALCGKTHMVGDIEGMKRLGIDPDSEIGRKIAECGFEKWDRLDGLHPHKSKKRPSHYNTYLNEHGYEGTNPWNEWAASAEDENGDLLSGWLLSHSDKPARVKAEDSETAYSTNRAIEFIEAAGDDRWCLHLSYIKPHWPYIVPAPYHEMYSADDVQAPIRDEAERDDPHPVLGAFQQHRVGKVFSREGVRERVIPAYMGLITQIDDEIGRLMAYLEETGRDRDTLIVFTSDHGDYLGDHWLGEKELFHEQSVRIPLIIVDPSPEADATRGTTTDALVEAIDLLPTFVEVAGGEVPTHILEGESLLPLLRDRDAAPLRDAVISEYDYSIRLARQLLDQPISDCRLQMIFDGRYKMVMATGFRPMLWDLQADPDELTDLGASEQMRPVMDGLKDKLLDWATRHHTRVTRSDAEIAKYSGSEFHMGVLIGFWDEAELAEAEAKGHGGN
jgi:arylsulfatase A-like enzyme